MRSKAGHLLAAALALLLSSCNDENARIAERRAESDAAIRRLVDPVHGAEELRRLLLARVAVSGSFISIKVYGDVQVIPASTPWSVKCSSIFGLNVTFGPGLGDSDNGLTAQISDVSPSEDDCAIIALSTAKVLTAVIAEK